MDQATQTMDTIIVQSASLECGPERAFEMFTINVFLEKWLTVKADVEPIVGGKYELFWEPNDPENDSTLGCKVLAVSKPDFINFEWKGPKQYKHFMNNVDSLTNVTVAFTPKDMQTQVILIHTGWSGTDEWQQTRQYFNNAWTGALKQLEKVVNGN